VAGRCTKRAPTIWSFGTLEKHGAKGWWLQECRQSHARIPAGIQGQPGLSFSRVLYGLPSHELTSLLDAESAINGRNLVAFIFIDEGS
jgi:hypothetical protein